MGRRACAGVVLLAAAATALLATSACLRQRSPHVILVVVDTLRADRVGATGGPRGLTPFLDELAAQGTVFRHAYAACSWTNPSVASLMTSRYPSQHQVTTFDARLPDAEVTLAEALAPHRYVTLGFSANLRLTEGLGFAQGFQSWAVFATKRKLRADRLGRRVLDWSDLVRGKTSTKPVFLYMQFMEPHAPYDPPPAFRARYERRGDPPVDAAVANKKLLDIAWKDLMPAEVDELRSLYDGEVASFDAALRHLFDGLRERKLLDDAIVVVTADHGEEFDEHGFMSHGDTLYDTALHVPLIVLGPGVPAGRVVDDAVSLLDVAPTILALARLPGEPRFQGRSLVPLLTGTAPPVDVIAQLAPSQPDFDPRKHTAALIRGTHKLMTLAPPWQSRAGEAQLYDLAADPDEVAPLGSVGGPASTAFAPDAPEGARAALLLDRLRQAEGALAQGGRPERVPLDAGMRERLRALGYVN